MNIIAVFKPSIRKDDGRKLSNKFTSPYAVQQISSMSRSESLRKPWMATTTPPTVPLPLPRPGSDSVVPPPLLFYTMGA
jgi:hypothetical protein